MFKKGYSMVEMLLVVAIVAMIFSFSIPFGLRFYRTQIIIAARNDITSNLLKAKQRAVLQKNDSNFGVKIDSSVHNFVLFQGDSFDDRMTDLDEMYDLPANINVSGLTEIVFSKLTGIPNVTGTTTISYFDFSQSILVEESGNILNVD